MNFNSYIGIKYKNLGRTFDGVDCYGLITLIYKEEKNIILSDYTELLYDKKWYEKGENHIIDNISTEWKKASKPYKMFDCILFYSISCKDIANHIGLYIGNNKFIHILEKTASMVSRLDTFWGSKVYKVFRYQRSSL